MNTLITLLIPLLVGLTFALLIAGIFITLSRGASMGQLSEQNARMQFLVTAHQLGERQRHFQRRTGVFVFIISGISTFLLGLFLAIVLPDVARLAGLAWLGASSLVWRALLFRRPLHVFVYDNGLVYAHLPEIEALRWDHIEQFWRDEHPGAAGDYGASYTDDPATYNYTLRCDDGKTYRLTESIADVRVLGELIERQVTSALLPRFIDACTRGETIPFGDLSVTAQMISTQDGKMQLPLMEVEVVVVEQERGSVNFRISRRGEEKPWYRKPVARIPNAVACKGLLDYLLQEQARRELPLVLATYQANQPVIFGRLEISLQGISLDHGQKRLPWKTVSKFEVTEQAIIIRSRDQLLSWKSLARWMVPNAVLLNELLTSILQKQQQDTQGQINNEREEMIANYNAGQSVVFGRLALSQQGVAVDQKLLSWNELSYLNIGLYFGGEQLVIRQRGRRRSWLVMRVSEIPNEALFRELLAYIQPSTREDQRLIAIRARLGR